MIIFTKVRWKNLLSYGNTWTEVDLTRSPSTMITGENGSGKSCVMDAISFGLFSKPFRKINKQNLVNIKNQKDMLVEIFFTKGEAEYKVVRGLNPSVFEIKKDGILIEQPGANRDYQSWFEKTILKFNYSTFMHLVLIGKATHVSFMKLDAYDRREFVENMLNLGIFAEMIKQHSENVAETKRCHDEARVQLSAVSSRIQLREETIRKMSLDLDVNYQEQVDLVNARRQIIEEQISSIKVEIIVTENPSSLISELSRVSNSLKTRNTFLEQFEKKINDKQSVITAIEAQETCNHCGQIMSDDHRKQMLSSEIVKLEKLKDGKLACFREVSDLEVQVEQLKIQIDEQQKSYDSYQSKLQSISVLSAELNQLQDPIKNSTIESRIKSEQGALQIDREELASIESSMQKIADEQENQKIITQMLKDSGLKSVVIRKFIPVINEQINEKLSKMGFFVKFNLDENFNETIEARGFDSLGYNNFSEGEKLRMDMAILLAWREVARLQDNLHTNLLFFDEIFDASLDAYGCESLAFILNELVGTNIFIVTHNPDKLADSVRSQIVFQKENGFSRLKPL